MFPYIFTYVFIGVYFTCTTATLMKDEERVKFHKTIQTCVQRHPISPEDQGSLVNWQISDTQEVKCFIACIFQGIGMIDEKGRFDAAHVNDITKLMMTEDDPDVLQQTQDITESCKYVNDRHVGDPHETCERAASLFRCAAKWTGKKDS
ncbi:hypothetical protein JYU34_013638 [Plutella xylostella]|uniref:Uncharacterized protein n=1 Tax=Plutella xylostella TaxID=51655 RepID=A0ABQ7QAB8_PLUXY|nr:hypothetical protein JYU34_013638 [Plutella xylostella]